MFGLFAVIKNSSLNKTVWLIFIFKQKIHLTNKCGAVLCQVLFWLKNSIVHIEVDTRIILCDLIFVIVIHTSARTYTA